MDTIYTKTYTIGLYDEQNNGKIDYFCVKIYILHAYTDDGNVHFQRTANAHILCFQTATNYRF